MKIRLGLIGGNIAASQSPTLHRAAGRLCGLDVSYDLLVPAAIGKSFDEVFAACVSGSYRGLNITYPFKEQVMSKVRFAHAAQAAIGSCNTVVLGAPPHQGFNTDFSGFVTAFRQNFPGSSPGRVAMAGAGGVGKAIAFALATLGASSLAIFDPNGAKADALKSALKQSFATLPVSVMPTAEDAVTGADGLVNCTPLGMKSRDGSEESTAFPGTLISSQKWAFDAVYTPIDTPFVMAARHAGLAVMTGYELFLHQGIDAFKIFTGCDVDSAQLRKMLQTSVPLVQSA